MGSLASVLVPTIAAGVGGAVSNKATQTTTPTLDPAYQGLQGLVLNSIQSRLQNGSLPQGYEDLGVKGINRTYDLVNQSIRNNLVSRGLATSPVAGAATTKAQVARAGDIGTFRTSLPLVQRELQTQDLTLGNDILRQGRGETATTSAGGGAGGAFENLAAMLGYLSGKGMFKQPGAAGVPAVAGGYQPY